MPITAVSLDLALGEIKRLKNSGRLMLKVASFEPHSPMHNTPRDLDSEFGDVLIWTSLCAGPEVACQSEPRVPSIGT